MKISRMNYDKPRRCPGWAGPGWNNMLFHRPNRKWKESTCNNGSIKIRHYKDDECKVDNRWWKFEFYKCDTCGVITLPLVTRNFDYYTYYLRIKYYSIYYNRYVMKFLIHTAPKFGWYSKRFWHEVKDEQ